jgi:hypothetical protein
MENQVHIQYKCPMLSLMAQVLQRGSRSLRRFRSVVCHDCEDLSTDDETLNTRRRYALLAPCSRYSQLGCGIPLESMSFFARSQAKHALCAAYFSGSSSSNSIHFQCLNRVLLQWSIDQGIVARPKSEEPDGVIRETWDRRLSTNDFSSRNLSTTPTSASPHRCWCLLRYNGDMIRHVSLSPRLLQQNDSSNRNDWLLTKLANDALESVAAVLSV